MRHRFNNAQSIKTELVRLLNLEAKMRQELPMGQDKRCQMHGLDLQIGRLAERNLSLYDQIIDARYDVQETTA